MEEFLPKHEYRPVTFWSLNSRLCKKEAKRQLDKLAEAGFGGVFLHSRVGLITGYMSDDWLDFIEFCVEYGDSVGLDMYLYDEDMWPSGYGSGEVARHSEDFHEKALLCIPPEEKAENDEAVAEYGGKLIVVRTARPGYTRFNGECFPDEMNPEAVHFFLEITHERYYKRLGKYFGNKIKGMFTDEPCYLLHHFHVEPNMPYSPYAKERFEKKYGEDFFKGCHKLFFDCDGAAEFRVKYLSAAAEQFEEAYTKQYAEWCSAHGIIMTGHLMAEDSCREQIHFSGGVMPHYGDMPLPGVDKIFKPIDGLVTLRQLTSVSEIENKRALCECFAGIGQEAAFFARKRIIDWQAVNGISFVNTHLSHYSLQGERKRDYPPDINYQQPYFACQKAENDYISRISSVASLGRRAVSVAVLQPLLSAFASYNPIRPDEPLEEDVVYDGVCKTLQSELVDFHILSDGMLENSKAEDGKLCIGEYRYDTVILPCVTYLTEREREVLSKFKGRVIAVGGNPAAECEKTDAATFPLLAKEMKKIVAIEGDARDIIACKRLIDGKELLIIANTGEEYRKIKFTAGAGSSFVGLYDGKLSACPEIVAATLCPHGSMCVASVASKEKSAAISPDGYILGEYGREAAELAFLGATDDNVLIVDKMNFTALGKSTGTVPLNHVPQYLFYPLADGTEFEAEYEFESDAVVDGAYALIENAENLDEILFNGRKVTPQRGYNCDQVLGEGCKIDVSLCICKFGGPIIKGTNRLKIKGKKYNNVNDVCGHRSVADWKNYATTEAEAIYVCGNFDVAINGDAVKIKERAPLAAGDVSGKKPFYSGGLEYVVKGRFRKGEQLLLNGDFASANAVCPSGKEAYISNKPAVFTVGEDCEEIRIAAYNTLFNMYGPHHFKGYKNRKFVDPGSFNDKENVTGEYLIERFGIESAEIIKVKENV